MVLMTSGRESQEYVMSARASKGSQVDMEEEDTAGGQRAAENGQLEL